MNVHVSYKVQKTPDIEKEISHQIEKIRKRLRVFKPELVHLKAVLEENSSREGAGVSLNLRLPSGQLAVEEKSCDSIDLRLVSDLVGAPVDEIEALNPSLLRMVTPPDASFDLHLPAGTATLFEQRAALIPEARRNSWRYHPVAAGDTLASVAQEYRVPVAELASANQLTPGESLAGIEALVVPVPLCRRAPGAHPALHCPPRRYPGHNRRPLRRLS